MPQYLLSTQSLVDIALRDGSAPERWLANTDARDPAIYDTDIFISAVSHALIVQLLDRMPRDADREALRLATEALIERFVGRGQVVDVTKAIADTWGALVCMTLTYTKDDNTQGQYPSGERLVMATAIKGTDGRPYILVARREPAYTALEPLGLALEDPHEMYP